MIAHLRGALQLKSPKYLIIEINGVGYEVTVPLSTFYELPALGSPVSLHVHTHVRENALQLYGFRTSHEKDLFIRLMGVNGIGPRLAVNILSGISAQDLVASVRRGDVARLTMIPGVGRKIAERIVVELKDKLTALDATGRRTCRRHSRSPSPSWMTPSRPCSISATRGLWPSAPSSGPARSCRGISPWRACSRSPSAPLRD